MSIFHQPVVYGPGAFRAMEREGPAPALLALGLAGLPGYAMLAGIAAAWLCIEGGKALHRRYQWCMRRGYYGMERRREEANRAFEEGLAELKRRGETDVRQYTRLVEEHLAALRRADEAFERETGRDAQDEHLARSGYVRLRGDESRRGGAWASPKAAEGRRRRRARRAAAWRDWARRFAEAARLGRPLPERPAGRRGGNGGAPVRKLCERSASPPPSREALLAQYEKAKGRGPVEEKLRLGSMMLDIEAAVDSSLVRDEAGEIVGRNAGVRGWIAENCPELARHYASLMGYRRLADEFRKVHGLRDPHPAARLLERPFPAGAFAPRERPEMRRRHAAARRLLASREARTAKGLAGALARTRRSGAAPLRRSG